MISRTVYYDHSGNKIDPPKADTVKPSNADRIRSMTDEELSEWIAGYALGLTGGALAMATEAWLEWLKQEVKE